jgi:hypothetical protein
MAVLQGACAGVDAADLGAEQSHPEDVERLAIHVFGAHVDVALQPEERAGGRARHAVLAGAGLGDDAPLAHASREQRLADRVVDLVRAGVRQIFALQENASAAGRLRQAPRFRNGRRPADVVLEQAIDFGGEARIVARRKVRALELLHRLDERLGHIAPAELAEVSATVRVSPGCHAVPRTAPAGAGDP